MPLGGVRGKPRVQFGGISPKVLTTDRILGGGRRLDFCDPQTPEQRDTDESANGLLRQHFPDGTDLSAYTQPMIDKLPEKRREIRSPVFSR